MSKQLGTTIHFQHTPGDCPRKAVTVKMFQMEDHEHFENFQDDDESDIGKTEDFPQQICESDKHPPFQILKIEAHNECLEADLTMSQNPVVEKIVLLTPTVTSSSDDATIISDLTPDEPMFPNLLPKVRKLAEIRSNWANVGVRKSKSPCTPVKIKESNTFATIDEGSEINCIDEGFAARNDIKYVPTDCRAVAAGSTTMALAGQTKEEVSPTISTANDPIVLNLGKMVVVKNLGVDILVGEPGKSDNKIVTFPHEKTIEMSNVRGRRIKIPYFSKVSQTQTNSFQCKSINKVTVYGDGSINVKLPVALRKYKTFFITPKNEKLNAWVKPTTLKTNPDGSVDVKNDGVNPVKLSKHEHFADLTAVTEVSLEDLRSGEYVRKIYDISRDDLSHLIPHEPKDLNENYLDQVSIDPDDVLSSTWRNKFKTICEEYTDIITPRPGKYNGYFGRIDNSINFTTAPPPSVRSHLPKYSHEMLKVMADKMDKLEEWGVVF